MAAARGEPVTIADLRVSAWQEACGPGHQPGDDVIRRHEVLSGLTTIMNRPHDHVDGSRLPLLNRCLRHYPASRTL
jgi:hypothetical protein